MGLAGILFGLAVLVWFAYRGWSVLLLAPAAALLAAAFAGEHKARPGQRMRKFRRVCRIEHRYHRAAQRLRTADRGVFRQFSESAGRQLDCRVRPNRPV